MKNNLIEYTDLYFSAFKNKDIKLLESLYREDVELIDWIGQWYGKESVLVANEDLFKINYDLFVNESNYLEDKSFNSLTIRFEEGPIDVLDVLYFDQDGKIKKIRAYKG